MSTVAVGQTVELKDGRHALVRFVGETTFAPGQWIGVELEDGNGKNDGSVQGERYFDCDMGRGMFLRIAGIARVVEEPARAPEDVMLQLEPPRRHLTDDDDGGDDDDDDDAEMDEEDVPAPPLPRAGAASAGAGPGVASRRRPSSFNPGAGPRASSGGSSDPTLARRMSMNAPSPSPVGKTTARPAGIRSPTKSPTKQLGSGPGSRTATPAGAAGGGARPPPKTRPSMGGAPRASMGPPPVPAAAARLRQASSSSSATLASSSRPGPVATQSATTTTRAAGGRMSLAGGRAAGGAAPSGRIGSAASRRQSTDSIATFQVATPVTQRPPDEAETETEGQQPQNEAEILSPQPQSPALSSRANNLERMAQAASAPSHLAAAAAKSSPVVPGRELEDLKAKIKVLERKRIEDRERIKQLDRVQAERDKYEAIIQKLQAKYQPQQAELGELKKALREAEAQLEASEQTQAGHDDDLELATLDREMAEEQAENLRLELDALKARAEELELELEVVREENAELGKGMSPEERSHAGWIQMERSNERLREALLRLRDLSQQQEEELRDRVRALEEEARDYVTARDEAAETRERLSGVEAVVEDLRQQLDTALGAEDMIEELSEQNGTMKEQIEELRAVIDDLEALKEVSDDLEVNHIQNERELQEELDARDSVIAEQARRAAERDGQVGDLEYTLSRFRELVTSLQGDLEDMRASSAVTESEQDKLNDRTRAMAELNRRLQISAAKGQDKTIDLELRRLEAQEAAEHLDMVRPFLPDAYRDGEQDSVLVLLRFRRVAFKAGLVQGFLKERVGGVGGAGQGQQPQHQHQHQQHQQHDHHHQPGHEDDVFEGCDAVDKLTWVAAACDRFAGSIRRGTTEQFGRYRGALHELEPVERALNGWIDGLRRDDLREKKCAAELQRSIALLTHLAEVHIGDDPASHADLTVMRTAVAQSHLESAAVALGTVRAMVQRVVVVPTGHGPDHEPATSAGDDQAAAPAEGTGRRHSEHGHSDETEAELGRRFAEQTEKAIGQTRSAKVVAAKVVRGLEELRERSLALAPETGPVFEAVEAATRELAGLVRRVGLDLHALLQEDGRAAAPTYGEIQTTIRQSIGGAASPGSAPDSDSDFFSAYLGRIGALAGQITDLAVLCGDLDQTREFDMPPPPWQLRAQELRTLQTMPVGAEEELRRTRDEVREAHRALRQAAEERGIATLRIETLESRMRDAHENAARIRDLQAHLDEARAAGSSLEEDISRQDRELKTLEAERDRWRKMASDSRALADGADAAGLRAGQERAAAAAREMEALQDQLAGLRAAVRFLRDDNRRARAVEQHGRDWLAEPLGRRRRLQQQPGDDDDGEPATTAAERNKRRRAAVAAEGRDALGELVRMVTSAAVFDLGRLPADRLAWRPARTTPQYHAASQLEQYAAWMGWQDSVLRQAEAVRAQERHEAEAGEAAAAASREQSQQQNQRDAVVARLQVRLPGVMDKRGGLGGEVRIVGSSEWERLGGKGVVAGG